MGHECSKYPLCQRAELKGASLTPRRLGALPRDTPQRSLLKSPSAAHLPEGSTRRECTKHPFRQQICMARWATTGYENRLDDPDRRCFHVGLGPKAAPIRAGGRVLSGAILVG